MHRNITIAIIGGGPSGLMAAEVLARNGMSVTVYDRMPSVGRKFLIAGRGGLNITHSEDLEIFISKYGAASNWLAPYIRAFPPSSVCEWCEGLGQTVFIGTSGRVFPQNMKATHLLRAWLQRLNSLGVEFHLRHNWQGWDGEALQFCTAENTIKLVTPDMTILALGGASWPRLGSDGAWVDVLRAQNVQIEPLMPANCGFIVPWSTHFSEKFAGAPLKPLRVTHNTHAQQGEAIITAQGIEGGVIYGLSKFIRESISTQGFAKIYLDLRPNMSVDDLSKKLSSHRKGQSFSTSLRKAGFSPLAIGLLYETCEKEKLLHMNPHELAQYLKAIPIQLSADAGMAKAISSAGGVVNIAFDDNLMLKSKPNVYAIGEMLNWEAPTGGYLLQACLSLGAAVARNIIAALDAKIKN